MCHALSYDGKETEGSVGTSRALEAAQAELAELVLEIDAELGAGVYQATKAELDGIDRGLKAAGEGKFVTSRPGRRPLQETPDDMNVVYTDEALENLAGILGYIASQYSAIYEAFQTRLQSLVLELENGRKARRKFSDGRASGSCP